MTKYSNQNLPRRNSINISIIVPCINEELQLPALLRVLREAGNRFDGTFELLVVDGGSTDDSVAFCEAQPDVQLLRSAPSRAVQMNFGAKHATGQVLYFVHADTRPPFDCLNEVWDAVKGGARIGGYAFEMDSQRRMLAFNSYLTKFNVLSTRGGDQTIFITQVFFEQLGGFCESMQIMEEYELLKRVKAQGEPYVLMDGQTIVSARKYEGRSWLYVQLANVGAMCMWRAGVDSGTIKRRYSKWLGM